MLWINLTDMEHRTWDHQHLCDHSFTLCHRVKWDTRYLLAALFIRCQLYRFNNENINLSREESHVDPEEWQRKYSRHPLVQPWFSQPYSESHSLDKTKWGINVVQLACAFVYVLCYHVLHFWSCISYVVNCMYNVNSNNLCIYINKNIFQHKCETTHICD